MFTTVTGFGSFKFTAFGKNFECNALLVDPCRALEGAVSKNPKNGQPVELQRV